MQTWENPRLSTTLIDIVLCILVRGRRCRLGSFFRLTHTENGHLCPFLCPFFEVRELIQYNALCRHFWVQWRREYYTSRQKWWTPDSFFLYIELYFCVYFSNYFISIRLATAKDWGRVLIFFEIFFPEKHRNFLGFSTSLFFMPVLIFSIDIEV